MSKPTIIITGANGFIGEQMVNHFVSKDWIVKAFVRSIPPNKQKNVEYILYSLEGKLNETDFDSATHIVHCAYMHFKNNNNANSINIEGTKALLEMSRKKSIQILFVSSFSAHNAAESNYGKTKLACEQLFDTSKDIIIKPGFVIGSKGLAGALISTFKKIKFSPLIGGGKQPIQTLDVKDLCLATETLLTNNYTGIYHIAETEAITIKAFYLEVAHQLNRKIYFIPFPLSFVLFISKIAEALKINLPLSSENVLGLKHLITFETKKDVAKIGVTIKNYRENLKSAIKA